MPRKPKTGDDLLSKLEAHEQEEKAVFSPEEKEKLMTAAAEATKPKKPETAPEATPQAETAPEPKKEKKILKSENTESPNINIDPFMSEAVTEKIYGKDNVLLTPDQTGTVPDIPEQDGTKEKPIINIDEIRQEQEQIAAQEAEEPEPEEPEPEEPGEPVIPPIPEITQLNKKDATASAKLLVNTLISLHNWLYTFAQDGLTIDQNKLSKWHKKGKLPRAVLAVQFDMGGELVTLGDIINDFNNTIAGVCNPENRAEMYDNIRPVLINMFVARGWGLKPEWYVLIEILKQTGMDLFHIVGANKMIGGYIREAKDYYAEIHGQNNTAGFTKPQSTPPPAPDQPPPALKDDAKEKQAEIDRLAEEKAKAMYDEIMKKANEQSE